jgi:hypothetical protein
MKFHPLANLFPLIEGAEFDELVASVRANGLLEAITVFEGAILDGRNRFRACQAADVEPRFAQFSGRDPFGFVAAKNIHRRNLTASQRGIIAAKMANLKIGRPPKNAEKEKIAEHSAIFPISQQTAAKLMDVHRDTVSAAALVLAEGTADEIAAVDAGRVGVHTVAEKIRDRDPRPRRRNSKGVVRPMTTSVIDFQERQKMNAQVYVAVKDALNTIVGLPRASDVAAMLRKVNTRGLIDAKLPVAIKWLETFSAEWKCQDD